MSDIKYDKLNNKLLTKEEIEKLTSKDIESLSEEKQNFIKNTKEFYDINFDDKSKKINFDLVNSNGSVDSVDFDFKGIISDKGKIGLAFEKELNNDLEKLEKLKKSFENGETPNNSEKYNEMIFQIISNPAFTQMLAINNPEQSKKLEKISESEFFKKYEKETEIRMFKIIESNIDQSSNEELFELTKDKEINFEKEEDNLKLEISQLLYDEDNDISKLNDKEFLNTLVLLQNKKLEKLLSDKEAEKLSNLIETNETKISKLMENEKIEEELKEAGITTSKEEFFENFIELQEEKLNELKDISDLSKYSQTDPKFLSEGSKSFSKTEKTELLNENVINFLDKTGEFAEINISKEGVISAVVYKQNPDGSLIVETINKDSDKDNPIFDSIAYDDMEVLLNQKNLLYKGNVKEIGEKNFGFNKQYNSALKTLIDNENFNSNLNIDSQGALKKLNLNDSILDTKTIENDGKVEIKDLLDNNQPIKELPKSIMKIVDQEGEFQTMILDKKSGEVVLVSILKSQNPNEGFKIVRKKEEMIKDNLDNNSIIALNCFTEMIERNNFTKADYDKHLEYIELLSKNIPENENENTSNMALMAEMGLIPDKGPIKKKLLEKQEELKKLEESLVEKEESKEKLITRKDEIKEEFSDKKSLKEGNENKYKAIEVVVSKKEHEIEQNTKILQLKETDVSKTEKEILELEKLKVEIKTEIETVSNKIKTLEKEIKELEEKVKEEPELATKLALKKTELFKNKNTLSNAEDNLKSTTHNIDLKEVHLSETKEVVSDKKGFIKTLETHIKSSQDEKLVVKKELDTSIIDFEVISKEKDVNKKEVKANKTSIDEVKLNIKDTKKEVKKLTEDSKLFSFSKFFKNRVSGAVKRTKDTAIDLAKNNQITQGVKSGMEGSKKMARKGLNLTQT